LSHAEVVDELASRGFDRATIYRNLVELAEGRLLARMELGDHVWRFEVRSSDEATSRDHPHFVCVDCGQISCLTEVAVTISPTPGTQRSSIADVTQVLLKGHCERCG
jgi:Fur family ferric uptake transcriptional regulator